jgi:hypothetical protein
VPTVPIRLALIRFGCLPQEFTGPPFRTEFDLGGPDHHEAQIRQF